MKLLLINAVVKALWNALRGRHTRKYGATNGNQYTARRCSMIMRLTRNSLKANSYFVRARASARGRERALDNGIFHINLILIFAARARAKYELALTRVRVYSGAAIFAYYNTI